MSSSTPIYNNDESENNETYQSFAYSSLNSSATSMDQLISPERIILDTKSISKRDVLTTLAQKAASVTGVDQDTIYAILTEREKLGSTGVGDGVAIPHGKIKNLDNIVGFIMRTQNPIDFDAMDRAPVDIFFLLIAPENATAEHLKALAKISRLLRSESIRDSLRKADTAQTIYAIACGMGKPETR